MLINLVFCAIAIHPTNKTLLLSPSKCWAPAVLQIQAPPCHQHWPTPLLYATINQQKPHSQISKIGLRRITQYSTATDHDKQTTRQLEMKQFTTSMEAIMNELQQ